MANRTDPDLLASDLDLQCLQMQGISGLSRTRVKASCQCASMSIHNVCLDKYFPDKDTYQELRGIHLKHSIKSL